MFSKSLEKNGYRTISLEGNLEISVGELCGLEGTLMECTGYSCKQKKEILDMLTVEGPVKVYEASDIQLLERVNPVSSLSVYEQLILFNELDPEDASHLNYVKRIVAANTCDSYFLFFSKGPTPVWLKYRKEKGILLGGLAGF